MRDCDRNQMFSMLWKNLDTLNLHYPFIFKLIGGLLSTALLLNFRGILKHFVAELTNETLFPD